LEDGYLEDALVSTTTATPSASTDNSQTASVPTPSGIASTTPKTDITSVFHSTPHPTAQYIIKNAIHSCKYPV